MDTILQSVAIYLFLLIVFRIAGKRELSQVTTFDFVLLLIIGEATQQALIGDDFSVTNSIIIILTLLTLSVVLSLVKRRWPRAEEWIDGSPLVIMHNGKLLEERMSKERIDKADILEAARANHGLRRLDQIDYAVLEKSGGITIIPKG